MSPIQKWQWALLIAYAAGKIEGKTRYHKLAFAIAKLTDITKLGFFDDWEPKDYGAFSRELQTEIDNLTRSRLLVSMTSQDGSHENFEPTEEAKEELKDVLSHTEKYVSAIRNFNEAYSRDTLDELLHDVYVRFPDFAVRSKIKGRIMATEYALQEKAKAQQEIQLEDYDARIKLSKMIGLDALPNHNPNALYELAGISVKNIKLKTIDVVDLVSESRSTDA